MSRSPLSLSPTPRLPAAHTATAAPKRAVPHLRRVRGVLFDLDGTLVSRRQGALVSFIMTLLPFARVIPPVRRICTLNSETQTLLRQLRQQGLRVGALSNSRPYKRRSIQALGLERLADCIVLSSEIGSHKPQRRAFQKAAARLGLAPERILFVGDRLRADMRGAHASGMRTMWITRRPPDAPSVDAAGRSVFVLRDALALKPLR